MKKLSFCMKVRMKELAKVMQRISIDQILNLSGETDEMTEIQ
jgi:hypothetical protein